MRQLPGGIVTMLFTDMEGSTRLLQQLGERYAGVLKEYRRLLREAFQQCSGHEVDTQGDAFFVVFERALDAVSAAIQAQRALFAAHWPDNVQVKARMGVHTGEPQPAEEGYIGLDVHRAARIMSVAHGGQVLLSQVTRDLVVDELPTGVALWYLGEHRLKDIAGRTRLFQLALPGLPDRFPLLSPVGSQQLLPQFPVPCTSFVGREEETAAVVELLSRPEVRLLTLVGTAGVGKTRLALHIATRVAESFAGNLAFVSLEQVSESDAVLPAIAQALNIQEKSTTPLTQQVQDFLNEQPFCLILDNFEQVIPARLTVSQLLTACPRLKILLTSRVLLRLQAEHLFEVAPLPLPVPESDPRDNLSALARSAAVALFVQRAQAVAPGFRLTEANAEAVREICARLDGLPLAIELAAARLRHVPVATVLSQLAAGLVMLEGAMQDIPARQRTLRGAIAWSYHLLEPAEQRVFRQLALFANGATLEAAQYVCGEGDEPDGEIAEIIRGLVDKSMVQRQQQEEQEARFWLLQTIGEYAKEQMTGAGEWQTTAARHAAYYLSWAERLAPLLSGAQQTHWLDQLDQEYDNVRAALAWLLKEAQEKGEQAEQALRLCVALLVYWEKRGYLKEGLAALEQALAVARGVAISLRAQAYSGAGFLALMLDDNKRAEHFLRECQVIFRESGDRAGMATILRLQGNLALVKNNYKIARRLLEEVLTIYQELGETRKVVVTREALAQVAMAQGDYTKARTLTTENLAIYRASGEVYAMAYPLYHLAREYFLARENLSETKALARESLASFKAVGDRRLAAYAQSLFGQILVMEGKSEEQAQAQAVLEESLEVSRAITERSAMVETLLTLARLATRQGEHERALDYYRESWSLLRIIGARELVALCLEGAGQLAVARNRPEQAVRLWAIAATIRAAIVAPLPPVYREDYLAALAQARARLGEETFRACWTQGNQTQWEQADPAE